MKRLGITRESDRMERVLEIFGERCDIDELEHRVKALDEKKKTDLLMSCMYLTTRVMSEFPVEVETDLIPRMNEFGLTEAFIIASIKMLYNDSEEHWEYGIDIYNERKYNFVIMDKTTNALDDSINKILDSLSEVELNTVVRDCIYGLGLNMSAKDLADFLVSTNFNSVSIVIKYFKEAMRGERFDSYLKFDTIYVKRVE